MSEGLAEGLEEPPRVGPSDQDADRVGTVVEESPGVTGLRRAVDQEEVRYVELVTVEDDRECDAAGRDGGGDHVGHREGATHADARLDLLAGQKSAQPPQGAGHAQLGLGAALRRELRQRDVPGEQTASSGGVDEGLGEAGVRAAAAGSEERIRGRRGAHVSGDVSTGHGVIPPIACHLVAEDERDGSPLSERLDLFARSTGEGEVPQLDDVGRNASRAIDPAVAQAPKHEARETAAGKPARSDLARDVELDAELLAVEPPGLVLEADPHAEHVRMTAIDSRASLEGRTELRAGQGLALGRASGPHGGLGVFTTPGAPPPQAPITPAHTGSRPSRDEPSRARGNDAEYPASRGGGGKLEREGASVEAPAARCLLGAIRRSG